MGNFHRFKSAKKLVVWFSCVFTAVFLVLMFMPVANLLARPLIVKPDLKKADLIVVLGGGAYKNGEMASSSMERLLRALILYKKGYANRIYFTGGMVVKQYRKILHTVLRADDVKGDDVLSEAAFMMNAARTLGVSEKDMAIDSSALNTIENLRHVKAYMAENGMKDCLLVTSSTHMLRASLIARKIGLNCYWAPVADTSRYKTTAMVRLNLVREVLWEYAGLALYRFYGYI